MSGGTGTAHPPISAGVPAPRPAVGGGPAFHAAGRATRLDLGPLPGAPSCARAHARAVLLGWDVPGVAIGDIVLAVSELVTNAVQATWRLNRTVPEPVTVRMTEEGQDVLVEVADASTDKPDPYAPEDAVDRGRGLIIVAALSAAWGSYPRGPAGKVVWARLLARPGHSRPARA